MSDAAQTDRTAVSPAGLRAGLRATFRWRRFRIAAALSGLLGVGLVLLPQFGVLGFEAALACAIVVPLSAGGLGAGLRRGGLDAGRPWIALAALLVASQVLVAIPLFLVVANMVRVPVCDPVEGLGFFLLLPAFGAAFAAVAGWSLALATSTARRAGLAFAAVAVVSYVVVAYRFFASPAVFFFHPFFGFYPGAIYDTFVPISGRLLSYRATNLVEAGTLSALVAFAFDRSTRRWSWRRLFRSRRAAAAMPLLCGACVALYGFGPELGHRVDSSDLVRSLGAHHRGETCDVHAPAGTSPATLRLLGDDCDFFVARQRTRLGLTGTAARVTVFAFGSEADKARAMGAGRTSVAKPWRREVYVQLGGFPHPVLEHEIAHVVLGEIGRPPFRVPARWGGLLPLPGLIEGGAVALEWPVDALDPEGWAAAMDRLGLLPGPGILEGVGFFSEAAGPAYTAAGAFVRRLLETRGPEAFRRLYRDGDFEGATGRSLEALWTEWRESLAEVPLDAAQLEAARARFDVPGFFAVRCPHAVAAAAVRRDERWAAGDVDGALAAHAEACRLSGDDPRMRAARARMLAAAGRTGEAASAARGLLEAPGLGTRLRDDLLELAADLEWRAGAADAARATYEALLERSAEAPERRLLAVKIHGTSDPEAAPFLVRYLFDAAMRPGATADEALGVVEAYAAARPDDPVAHYLLGRVLFGADRFAEAEAPLWYALEHGLAPDEVRFEAIRLLIVVGWRAGDPDQVEIDATVLGLRGGAAERAEAAEWLERVAWKRGRDPAATPPAAEAAASR
jgi:hypothetical protein